MMTDLLPEFYMITGKFKDHNDFKLKLTNALSQSNKIVQFRNKNIPDPEEYIALAKIAESVCKQFNSILLLATSAELFTQTNADGLHLDSKAFLEYEKREYDKQPVLKKQLLSVSCHTLGEMKQAEKLGADILLLSPVKETSSHPDLPGIGWQQFKQLIRSVNCPVYALGGMQAADLLDAKQAGAQGVASISALWN